MNSFPTQYNLKYRFRNPPRWPCVAHGIKVQYRDTKFDKLFTLVDHPLDAGIFHIFFRFTAADQVAKIIRHVNMEGFGQTYQLF
jgi:hypothetical protein